MLELLLCSLFTIFPDYLYRRYQGKRIGKEITIYSVWYEYRYGITSCLMLTIAHHDRLLQSSLDEQCHVPLPHDFHSSRGKRQGIGSTRWPECRCEEG